LGKDRFGGNQTKKRYKQTQDDGRARIFFHHSSTPGMSFPKASIEFYLPKEKWLESKTWAKLTLYNSLLIIGEYKYCQSCIFWVGIPYFDGVI